MRRFVCARRSLRPATLFLLVLSVLVPRAAQAAPPPAEQVPTFQLRARITSAGGKAPAADQKFTLQLGGATATVAGDAWSEWIKFDRAQVDAALKGYSPYGSGFPVQAGLSVRDVVDPTHVEGEFRLEDGGKTVPFKAELYGPNLGLCLWRDENNQAMVGTFAQYNQRYWKAIEDVRIPEERRPKKFPITDRFIGVDNDRIAWRDGISNLTHAGLSAIMLPPDKVIRSILNEMGIERTAWAVYNPPGYAFEPSAAEIEKDPNLDVDRWAQSLVKPYLDAGYEPEDVAVYAISDEPGWYYPTQLKYLDGAKARGRFIEYLKSQKLEPKDLGAVSWDDVKPIGRSGAKDLPSKRLFYWTMRFFPWDSSRHFANATKAMERAFYPGIPVFTNWNFFAGRSYVPGGVANNPDKQHPDAAMGGHDWLEFGRMRGGTLLWTEDWFGDEMAPQWSFYCAKLRSAAVKGGVEFGGYVIPRTAGSREDGIVQKMLTIAGSGGKSIKFFVFGPEFTFPGNCYSENPTLLRGIAEAAGMIGAAEELLWEGRRPKPQVAILSPKSSQFWDPVGVSDATNTNLNAATVDYMAEVADLYMALQHANIPVDFVEEEDLSPEGLKDYRVVYVTEPNIPEEHQRGLTEWVNGGGTLVTVSNTGTRDRYDEPSNVLAEFTKIEEEPRERLFVPNLGELKEVGTGKSEAGPFTAVGVRGTLDKPAGDVVATFDDNSPAIVSVKAGEGRVGHFAWMPGLSYAKSGKYERGQLPSGFAEPIRKLITWPVEQAGVEIPVTASVPFVETPLLVSDKGATVTVLNWTNAPIEDLELTVRVPFEVKSVESVRGSKVGFRKTDDGSYSITLPVDSVDILMLRK